MFKKISLNFILAGTTFFLAVGLLSSAHADSSTWFIPSYKDTHITSSSEEHTDNWQLPISKNQKVDGVWRFEKIDNLAGQLS